MPFTSHSPRSFAKGKSDMSPDKLLALHHFCVYWHGGQGSREYRILSRVSRVFTPSRSEEYLECLANPGYETAREYYIQLVTSYLGGGKLSSGYITCPCCGHAHVVDHIQAMCHVTMCDECTLHECSCDRPGEGCESDEVCNEDCNEDDGEDEGAS